MESDGYPALGDARLAFGKLTRSVAQFIQGTDEAVRMALVCLFAEGHLLIEGQPGVAKTSLAKAIAAAIGRRRSDHAVMRRIQFTPDLMPSDVTGGLVYDQESGRLLFRPGAVFCHVLLADEVNRAAPKTQSALLEVMEERQVTIDGEPYEVPKPFLCIATRNPQEHLGTYPLPDAQLDRFMMMVKIGYPPADVEKRIIDVGLRREQPQQAISEPVIDVDDLLHLMKLVRDVPLSEPAKQYIVDIAAGTRLDRDTVELGLSPRGSIALARAAQAYAVVEDPAARASYAGGGPSAFVAPDDIKRVAPAVMGHRIRLGPKGVKLHQTAGTFVQAVLDSVPVPDAPSGRR